MWRQQLYYKFCVILEKKLIMATCKICGTKISCGCQLVNGMCLACKTNLDKEKIEQVKNKQPKTEQK